MKQADADLQLALYYVVTTTICLPNIYAVLLQLRGAGLHDVKCPCERIFSIN